MDDKAGSDMLKTFMKQPVSTINLLILLTIPVGYYYAREASLAKLTMDAVAQDRKIEKIETKIAADNIEDTTRSQRLSDKIGEIDGRLKGMEADIRWLVRTARPFSLTDPPRNP